MRSNKQLEKEITDAAQSEGFGEQVLRTVREGYAPHQIWQSLGRCYGFSEASLLLAALCERSWELGSFFYGEAARGSQEHQAEMRAMQRGSPETSCSSHGWQLSEQFSRQLANALSKVPQTGALAAFNGFPLATGIPGRVGRLRAYGNAIVPQVAAAFVEVAMQYAP